MNRAQPSRPTQPASPSRPAPAGQPPGRRDLGQLGRHLVRAAGHPDPQISGFGCPARLRWRASAYRTRCTEASSAAASRWVSPWLSLALSAIAPAIRSVAGFAVQRTANLLALLMLAVNLAGIVVSFLSGDPRAMIAKDSLVSSVIAVAILLSVAMRRPLMSAGLKPYMTKGTPDRTAAWDRLSATSGRFRRLERAFSTIWGLALLAECVARLVGAYTLPVTRMVWLGTVFTLGAIGQALVIGGVAVAPIQKMIDAETAAS